MMKKPSFIQWPIGWEPGKKFHTIWKRQGKKCFYCGKRCAPKYHSRHPQRATKEHLKRKTDGGTNKWKNMAVACVVCNTTRGDIDWKEYKERGGFYGIRAESNE